MKIKKFNEFINENYKLNEAGQNYRGNYNKVTHKIYPKKKYGEDAYDKQNDLDYSLGILGFPTNITVAKLIKHPDFAQLDDNYKDDILKIVGIKKTPNAGFVKLFVEALDNWQGIKSTRDLMKSQDIRDLKDSLYYAGGITKDLKEKNEEGILYNIWDGLSYPDRKAIKDKYKDPKKSFFSFTNMYKNLTSEEKKFIIKYGTPYIKKYAKQHFTDHKIEQWIKAELTLRYKGKNGRYSAEPEEYTFSGTSWTQKSMAKPLAFIKKLLMDGTPIDWDKFKVEREMEGSEQGAVASSSFSTTYYYTVKLTINGKTFNMKRVIGGSDYYSGGWS